MNKYVLAVIPLIMVAIPTNLYAKFDPLGPHGEVLRSKPKSFRIQNGTKYDVIELYVVHPEDNEWGPNVLQNRVLQPGQATTFGPADGRPSCTYSFRAILTDKDPIQNENVNFCLPTDVLIQAEP